MDLFVAHHHAPSEAVALLGSASIAETGEAEQGHEDLDGGVGGEQDEGNGAAVLGRRGYLRQCYAWLVGNLVQLSP